MPIATPPQRIRVQVVTIVNLQKTTTPATLTSLEVNVRHGSGLRELVTMTPTGSPGEYTALLHYQGDGTYEITGGSTLEAELCRVERVPFPWTSPPPPQP